MKKIYLQIVDLLAWVSILAMAAWVSFAEAGMTATPGMAVHTHSDANSGGGTLTVSNTLSSTKACGAAGFTRLTPNYCTKTTPTVAGTALTRDTCTAITTPTADAIGVYVRVVALVKSANVASAIRSANTYFFTDSGCTSPANGMSSIEAWAMEFNALAAGTTIAKHEGYVKVRVPAPYIRFTDDAGNQGAVSYEVVGYYD